ncbi:MAG TPA: hypothetical protein VFF29_08255, partial [Bacteroidota bacterium]|nr:hypothetical protein [Bacteroidota bacterium]
MINTLRFFSFFVLLVFVIFTSNSQITITKSDVDAGFLNVKRMDINVNYDPHPSVNLGNAIGSAQTFNFASIAGTDTSRDTTLSSYVTPTGLPGADQFPSANIAQILESPPPVPGGTLTSTIFLSSESDGFYALGVATHYVVPGFIDTLFIYHWSPKLLYVPLPLTLGTQRTAVDTFYQGPNNYEVATRTFDANGYGTVTLPNGTSAQAIRVINDRVDLEYTDGVFSDRNHNREVFFITENSDYLSFQANDTNYTSGTTSVRGYDMSIKGGAVDVR